MERPLAWVKLSVFFALASRLLALPLTPPLRRFFCSAELPEAGGLPFPLRFSPLAAWSLVLTGAGGEPSDRVSGEGDLLPVVVSPPPSGSDALLSGFAPEEEPPPNILLSRPPWEERLRRLGPARLLGGILASLEAFVGSLADQTARRSGRSKVWVGSACREDVESSGQEFLANENKSEKCLDVLCSGVKGR